MTVALLCWNQERFVREAIESVGDQTLSDVELIVIDNSSGDRSVEVIRDAMSGITVASRFIGNPVNVGISRALNQAMEASNGTYFVPFAADDVMLPDRLAHQVGRLESLGDRVAGIVSSCRVIDAEGSPGGYFRPPMTRSMRDLRLSLIDGSARPAAGTMLRRSTLDRLGGYDPASPFEDLDMAARIVFELGELLEPDPTVVSLYRRHSTNTTANPRIMAAGLAYTHARLGQFDLSRRERREIRRLALRSINMTWFRFTGAVASGDVSVGRSLAWRASVQRGLGPMQRLRALGYGLAPRTAARFYLRRSALDDGPRTP